MGNRYDLGDELSACASGEELVHGYVDAELATEKQPILFAHLAGCESCRRLLDSVMLFRSQSRQERIVVPAASDAAFMLLLEKKRKQGIVGSNAHERQPVWKRNVYLSRGSAAVLAVVLLAVGFMVPRLSDVQQTLTFVVGHQESVQLLDSVPLREAVYVFYPGITVEEERD